MDCAGAQSAGSDLIEGRAVTTTKPYANCDVGTALDILRCLSKESISPFGKRNLGTRDWPALPAQCAQMSEFQAQTTYYLAQAIELRCVSLNSVSQMGCSRCPNSTVHRSVVRDLFQGWSTILSCQTTPVSEFTNGPRSASRRRLRPDLELPSGSRPPSPPAIAISRKLLDRSRCLLEDGICRFGKRNFVARDRRAFPGPQRAEMSEIPSADRTWSP
jgi:hypothetical protein